MAEGIPMPLKVDLIKTFNQSTIPLPAGEVMLFLVFITICLLLRLNRLGIIVSFIAAYRWGWIYIGSTFRNQYHDYTTGYFFFGVSVVLLYIVSLFLSMPKRE